MDLQEPEAVADALDGTQVVVHLAARSGGIQFQHGQHRWVLDDNTRMTRNVLDAAVASDVRRVFLASSGVVYSRHGGEVLTEDSPVVSAGREPVTGYAWSKLTDEVLGQWTAAQHEVEVVIGRFTNVYGPGGSFDPDRSTVVHALVKKAVDASPDGVLEVWGDGTPVRSFVYVEDAARAIIAVLTRGEPLEIYNITGGDPVSIGDVAEQIRQQVSSDLEIMFDTQRPQGPRQRVLDGTRLRSLGFHATTSVAEGLRRTIIEYVEGHT